MKELYLWGVIDQAEYRGRQANLERQLTALTPPQERAVTQAAQYLEQIATLWDNADLRQRRDLLNAIVDAVHLDVLARRLVCVEPKPEFAVLFRRIDELEERNGCFYIKGEAATSR